MRLDAFYAWLILAGFVSFLAVVVTFFYFCFTRVLLRRRWHSGRRRSRFSAYGLALGLAFMQLIRTFYQPDVAYLLEVKRDEDADEAATSAVRDVQDLEMADCLILHNGVARRDTRGGNHFEMGAAWALGKRVIVVGVVGNVFHMLPEVEIFSTWPECLEGL